MSIHLEENLGDVMVPSMLFQPLVENALKHGIEPSVEGGVIDNYRFHQLGRPVDGGEKYRDGASERPAANVPGATRGVGLRNTEANSEGSPVWCRSVIDD